MKNHPLEVNRIPFVATIICLLLFITGCTKPYAGSIKVLTADTSPPDNSGILSRIRGGPPNYVEILLSPSFWEKQVALKIDDPHRLREVREGFSAYPLSASKTENIYTFEIGITLKSGDKSSFDLIFDAFSEFILRQEKDQREHALENLRMPLEQQTLKPQIQQVFRQRIEIISNLPPTRISVVEE